MWRKTILLVACYWFANLAHGALVIEITKGTEEALPIAVVPFGWQEGGAPYDLAQVVSNDLETSGRFAPMAREDMLERPTTGSQIVFSDWRLLNTDVVVVGRVLPNGNNFTIEFQVFDVLRGEQLLGYRMPSTRSAMRASAHRIADMIFEKLTGIPGAFSTRIAYVTVEKSGDATSHSLVVADADGENQNVIAESSQPIMSPAWSPDGRKLAYVSFEERQAEIYVQTLRTGNRQRTSGRAGVNGAPAWSPDGQFLALTLSTEDGNLDIYTLDLRSQVLKRLTTSPSIDTEPEWSTDGEDIYFTSDRSGGPQVYVVPADGGKRPKRLTFEGSYNARPRLSPDAGLIAVVHNDRGNYRIAVVDTKNSTTQVLTQGQLDESPSFAPNGNTVIYATREQGVGVLATVSVDGKVHRRLASQAGDVREPVWSPYPRN